MRVACISQWWEPEPAAIVSSLGRELARRHDVTVLTGFPNYPAGRVYDGYQQRWRSIEDRGGHRLVRVPLYASHDASVVRRTMNYVSFAASASAIGLPHLRRPDVAYVYHPPLTTVLPAWLLRRTRSVPFVLHVQDLWPESVVRSDMAGGAHQKRRMERLLSRACLAAYRAAAHIVVISPGFRDTLVERGVPPDKISVVLNWADDDLFFPQPADPEVRALLGPADRRILLYAGNFGHFQGLDRLVDAMASLQGTSLHLALMGDGVARPRIEELVASTGADNVTLLPPCSLLDSPRFLAAADAHCITLVDEPFFAVTIPGKTQVAMAMERFALMAVRGDAADLVTRAGAGLAVLPDEDSIRRGLHELEAMPEDELRRRARTGRTFYEENLSLGVATARFEGILSAAASPADSVGASLGGPS